MRAELCGVRCGCRRAAEAEGHRSRAALLEKQIRELQWQVAMLAGTSNTTVSGSPVVAASRSQVLPHASNSGNVAPPNAFSIAGVLGWILRHRKGLMVGYAVMLHFLVYYSLTHGLWGALTHHTIVMHHPEGVVHPSLRGAGCSSEAAASSAEPGFASG
jgi:hypothetical protein